MINRNCFIRICFVFSFALLSGCTKCSEEKRPHVGLGSAGESANGMPARAGVTGESGAREGVENATKDDNGANGTTSEKVTREPLSLDEKVLLKKIENSHDTRRQAQEKRGGTVRMDNPGPAKPNEDRD